MTNRQPSNRRVRRRPSAGYTDITRTKLPGFLGIVTNPKIFVVAMLLMGSAMLLSVLPLGNRGAQTSDDGQIHQAGELEDKPLTTPEAGEQPQSTPAPAVRGSGSRGRASGPLPTCHPARWQRRSAPSSPSGAAAAWSWRRGRRRRCSRRPGPRSSSTWASTATRSVSPTTATPGLARASPAPLSQPDRLTDPEPERTTAPAAACRRRCCPGRRSPTGQRRRPGRSGRR